MNILELMNGFAPLWEAADEGAGTSDGDSTDAPVEGDGGGDNSEPSSILFPNDKKEGEGSDNKDEWKEYEPNSELSDEENEAAKAEHDKGKPDGGAKVPDTYELEMPEGVELDTGLIEKLSPVFKDLSLSNEQAQKLTDQFIEHQQTAMDEQAKTWAETVEKWGNDAKNDKEIGGANWDKTQANALKFVGKHGTTELKEYFDQTGAGNHPEVIRIMAKAGAMISEDDPAISQGGGSGQPVDPAHILFPNDKPKG